MTADRLPARRVLLATPHGWCAGVDRAVRTVEKAIELYGPPVYVRALPRGLRRHRPVRTAKLPVC
jgi:hypothetical protein